MDYTTSVRVKLALGANETADDTLLASLVTAVSRSMDRKMTGRSTVSDYLKQETISNETMRGLVNKDGCILAMPCKPLITAVTAFAYRWAPNLDWTSVEVGYVAIEGYRLTAFTNLTRGMPFVKISYSGGFATTTDALPADILDIADLLAVRYYKEIKSGLGDAIGVAELGQLIYTKAWPVRVVEMLKPYFRRIA